MPPLNNWDTAFPDIRFLTEALSTHKAVSSFTRTRDIVFTIERPVSETPIVMVLIKRYTVGLADVIAVMKEFPDATCIVAPGDWAGYTKEAKEYGIAQKVGVFNTSEFFGALWKENPLLHARRSTDGSPTYAYHDS